MLSRHSQDAFKTLLRCSDDAFKMLSRLTQDALKRTSNHALKMLSSTLPSMLSSILPTALDDILPASLTICLLVSCQDAPKYTLSTFPVDLLVSSEVYFWACSQVYSKLHLMTHSQPALLYALMKALKMLVGKSFGITVTQICYGR